jgi:hypothetical protein
VLGLESQAALTLLVRHRLDAAAVLDLHLARHQERANLQVGRRLLLADLLDSRRAMPLEVGDERAWVFFIELHRGGVAAGGKRW